MSGPAATPTSPGAAFSGVVATAVDLAARKASRRVEQWTGRLNDVASRSSDRSGGVQGGAKRAAAAGGIEAGMAGTNPVVAAIRGAWEGGTVATKAAIVAAVAALVLLAVVSPVLLLVFVLSLLVIAAIAEVRSRSS